MKKLSDLYESFIKDIKKGPVLEHDLFDSVVHSCAIGGVNADFPTELTYMDVVDVSDFSRDNMVLYIPHEYIPHMKEVSFFSDSTDTLRKDHKHMYPIGTIPTSMREIPVFKYLHTFYKQGLVSMNGRQVYQALLVCRDSYGKEKDVSFISVINCTLPIKYEKGKD